MRSCLVSLLPPFPSVLVRPVNFSPAIVCIGSDVGPDNRFNVASIANRRTTPQTDIGRKMEVRKLIGKKMMTEKLLTKRFLLVVLLR